MINIFCGIQVDQVKWVINTIRVLYYVQLNVRVPLHTVPFPFNSFDPTINCTCVNHEIIVSGSAREFFRMYNLHTLISSLKILSVLSQKNVMSPFRDFRESQNPPFSSLLIPFPQIIARLTEVIQVKCNCKSDFIFKLIDLNIYHWNG